MNTRIPQSRPTGRFRLTALALALSAMLPAQAKTLAYIPSQGSNTVTVINTANDQIVRRYKRLTPDRAGPFAHLHLPECPRLAGGRGRDPRAR